MRGWSMVFTLQAETYAASRDERDLAALAGEQLGEHAAEVVLVVVVEDDAVALRPRAGEQVVGRQHFDPGELERIGVAAPDAVGAPARAGRDGDVPEAVGEHLVGGDLALERELDVRQLRELPLAVVDDADPLGEPGQPRLAQHPAAELAGRLGEHHRIAALAERLRRLEAGRPGADDEHVRVGALRPGSAPDASRGATPPPSTGSGCSGSASSSSRR